MIWSFITIILTLSAIAYGQGGDAYDDSNLWKVEEYVILLSSRDYKSASLIICVK